MVSKQEVSKFPFWFGAEKGLWEGWGEGPATRPVIQPVYHLESLQTRPSQEVWNP